MSAPREKAARRGDNRVKQEARLGPNGKELQRVFLVESYRKPSGVLGLRKRFVWREKP